MMNGLTTSPLLFEVAAEPMSFANLTILSAAMDKIPSLKMTRTASAEGEEGARKCMLKNLKNAVEMIAEAEAARR